MFPVRRSLLIYWMRKATIIQKVKIKIIMVGNMIIIKGQQVIKLLSRKKLLKLSLKMLCLNWSKRLEAGVFED